MPQLLHDLLRHAIVNEANLECLESHDGDSLAVAADRLDADIVIADERVAEPSAVRALLERRPRSRMLAVASDGRTGVLYELRPHRQVIGEMSVAAVLASVQRAPSQADAWHDDPPPPAR